MSEARPPAGRIAMVTYSTKPRGGVVHTLHVAEALSDLGWPVHLFALGDPGAGFFRPVRVPATIFDAPGREGTLEERVAASTDALAGGLTGRLAGRFDAVHVQDCIAARAAMRVRDAEGGIPVIRTVHHVDDFTTPALIECQRRSILDPDHLIVVSRDWRRRILAEFGRRADVVTNGVDLDRFAGPAATDGAVLRARAGARDGFLFLTVGGLEPRKGSLELVEALARVRREVSPPPAMAVVGGHSFQDHTPYASRVMARAAELGLGPETGLTVVGTVGEDELTGWYQAADGFVFPSVKEGWGLALIEALAAGLPAVAADLPVFHEFLSGDDALLVQPGNSRALAAGMRRLVEDGGLRESLGRNGPITASRFTWRRCAEEHAAIYPEILRSRVA